jgi:fibronectin type 3 domain-containing protein
LEVLLLRCILGIASLIMVFSAGCAGGNTTGDTTGTIQHSVSLSWAASTPTVLGYNVYRVVQSGGPYTQMNEVLDVGTNYVDNTVQSGQTYYYVVTAEGTNGLESVYSNEVVMVIPFP